MALEPTTHKDLMAEQKEEAETTSNFVVRRTPRPRLSFSQFIMRASVAISLLAVWWRLPDIWAATSHLILRQTTPNLNACPGHFASAITTTSTGLTAQLHLANGSCNVYGPDLQTLSLAVTYETG